MEDYNMPQKKTANKIWNEREDFKNLTLNEKKLKLLNELGNEISNDNRDNYKSENFVDVKQHILSNNFFIPRLRVAQELFDQLIYS